MPKVRIDDTLEMHYEDDDFTDPWKSADTLVLQHCNGGSSTLYYSWVPVIARHFRMIRVDRRGQGQSTVPDPGFPWSLSNAAREMDVFLDRVHLQAVHILGEATGAYVCLQYAYEHPDRVKSLTLVNFTPKPGASPMMQEYARLAVEEGVEAAVRKTMASRFDPSKVDPEYIEWHAQEKIRQPQHVTAEGIAFLSKADVTELLPQIKVPTLVIAGDNSETATTDNASRLREMIPNCKVAVIPGVSGFVAHVAPESSAEAWLDFVRELP